MAKKTIQNKWAQNSSNVQTFTEDEVAAGIEYKGAVVSNQLNGVAVDLYEYADNLQRAGTAWNPLKSYEIGDVVEVRAVLNGEQLVAKFACIVAGSSAPLVNNGATSLILDSDKNVCIFTITDNGTKALKAYCGTSWVLLKDAYSLDVVARTGTFSKSVASAGTLSATGATTLGSTLTASGATNLNSTLAVKGATTLTGNLTSNGTTTTKNLQTNGWHNVTGALTTNGATTLKSTLAVTGKTTMTGGFTSNAVSYVTTPAATANDTSVATTAWVRGKCDAAKEVFLEVKDYVISSVFVGLNYEVDLEAIVAANSTYKKGQFKIKSCQFIPHLTAGSAEKNLQTQWTGQKSVASLSFSKASPDTYYELLNATATPTATALYSATATSTATPTATSTATALYSATAYATSSSSATYHYAYPTATAAYSAAAYATTVTSTPFTRKTTAKIKIVYEVWNSDKSIIIDRLTTGRMLFINENQKLLIQNEEENCQSRTMGGTFYFKLGM